MRRFHALVPPRIKQIRLELEIRLSEILGLDSRTFRWTGNHLVELAKFWAINQLSQGLKVSDLAAYLGLHPVHLNRIFHKHCQQSTKQFLKDFQMAAVDHLLSDQRLTLKEIAAQTGFNHVGHLCRCIKIRHGQCRHALLQKKKWRPS